ncbi:pyruvate:ferredoxin (flavodoxin) oxidoreductase [Desulfoprunum benzoelyticum]|uniref:Pyruvate:ferredoxin oxidoreductase n=1 Tax=Desulfoprunum benzoelyticum TaxID=1506996 RepID=A0A840UMV1_9BACT|nr:pyruvate:ferredoxin (flavodoxin) oxidoreductase [Desulfoprunum benzoelyticum]MBB5347597.1 pyruvate-ferredoxin/flavodoxin oxidoreductase [Desulfoprunum benzoelyticum]MBM9531085.1 pyruvate:ferredoxin (flavodoxin) oxidoreductase [Desulfoprunum benzoelyticum]
MSRRMVTIDGNQACTHVAYATSEVITIYPITPSSPMAAEADAKAAVKQKNIWNSIPVVTQMQSEAGVAGALHGSLTTGSLCTTFTASQGLLLMIPNMYKIAGELTPTVFHITARSLAAQGLSIFGDHADVYAARQTGWGMLCAQNVQESMDMALISTQASLKSRIPFMHFFDGFRTSHEIQKVEELTYDDMRAVIDDDLVIAHRRRALSPDRPMIRGTAQNPDVYFTGRETVNKYYNAVPAIMQETMDKLAAITGRQYHLFDYHGAPDAENVVVMMGSGCETVASTVDYLVAQGRKVGLVIVRLYRPFDGRAMVNALPPTVERITVLDRTKEPGAIGEPLYLDVRAAVGEAVEANGTIIPPIILSGRYGLGSAEFTPAMVKAVFDNMVTMAPKNKFCVGPNDDVTFSSLDYDRSFNIEGKDVYRAMFYGLGSDGTVGANKNTIKIIGTETDNSAQGYFVYDSKKSGSITTSHLRFGKNPVVAPYLINKANFIACHNFTFLDQYDMLRNLEDGGTFLLTTSYGAKEIWKKLPKNVQRDLIDKKAKFYIIDAVSLGLALGLGARINMIMQTAFFMISGILTQEEAIAAIKKAIKKTYGNKGDKVVNMNYSAVDEAIKNIVEVKLGKTATGHELPPTVPTDAPDFVKEVTAKIIEGKGELLKVSQIPDDGTWPTATTQYEKRNIAVHTPEWLPDNCIQCGQCALVCPHAAIRTKVVSELKNPPKTFKSTDAVGKEFKGSKFIVQVFTEDCCSCTLCVSVCPAKTKALQMIPNSDELRSTERGNVKYFLDLPEIDPARINPASIKGSQLLRPLFEFSGACAGCGETPYVKLVSQLFGDRMLVANATGCSSIYGGNLPTTPYAKRVDGRGPAWSNSLFEDNAEFGLGMRFSVNKLASQAAELLEEAVSGKLITRKMADGLLQADQPTQTAIEEQRGRVAELKAKLEGNTNPIAVQLYNVADYLVKKSVWIIGGDGWAYDIGYGGLDHVLASGENVNVLLLDTEVYSNTGGQMSKSTPRAATAQFAAGGKRLPKKDIGMIFSTYGNVYIGRISLGANPSQAIKAIAEAEAYDGPSLIIAYAHCINHGINMAKGLEQQKKAVACGHWPLYRYNPDLEDQGKNPLIIDSKDPSITFEEYALGENRYRALKMVNPTEADALMAQSQKDVLRSWKFLKGRAQAMEPETEK